MYFWHAGRAEHDSQRRPGNQLQFSWGRGLATGEWQHARQPHDQAVIIWFTHNQLLIVSRWSAGTCNLEENMNSQGLSQAELSGNEGEAGAFMCLAPGSPVQETREPDFCALTIWSTADMTGSGVASQYNNTESSPNASVFSSRKTSNDFFFAVYSIAVFCQSDQLHAATVSSGHCGSLQRGATLYKVYLKKNGVSVLLQSNIGQLKLWIMWHSECSYIKWDAINHLSLAWKRMVQYDTPSFSKHCLNLVLSRIHDIREEAADSPEHQNTDSQKIIMTALLIYSIIAPDQYIFCSCSTITIYQVRFTLQRLTF